MLLVKYFHFSKCVLCLSNVMVFIILSECLGKFGHRQFFGYYEIDKLVSVCETTNHIPNH